MRTTAWQVDAAGAALQQVDIDTGSPAAGEVEIAIDWCGLCHSDLHLLDDDWGTGSFPLIPGHEIIGRVTAVGADVESLAAGDKVGVGWQAGSCGRCAHCEAGDENVCTGMRATCIGRPGGLAGAIRVPARFAFALPEALYRAAAAPLFCGGITVFAPLQRHGVGPGMRVAIAGYGGLGHLAVRFAAAMGAEVTVISGSPDKRDDALADGASHFIEFDNKAQRKRKARHFDFMLSAISANRPWHDYLALLKPDSTLCMVGAPAEPLEIRAGALIGGQKSVAGSAIGGSRAMQDMLAFAAEKDIVAAAECLPVAQVNEAFERLRQGDVRYRMVLEMSDAG